MATWDHFDYSNILREAKARLVQAWQHPTKITPEQETLEYWCAWVAHANALAVDGD